MTKPKDSELEFPLTWHFRIIAEDQKHMCFMIEKVLLELDIHDEVTQGNSSRQGKYATFNVTVTVNSKEALDLIDHKLCNIEGVRMVL